MTCGERKKKRKKSEERKWQRLQQWRYYKSSWISWFPRTSFSLNLKCCLITITLMHNWFCIFPFSTRADLRKDHQTRKAKTAEIKHRERQGKRNSQKLITERKQKREKKKKQVNLCDAKLNLNCAELIHVSYLREEKNPSNFFSEADDI